MFEKKRGTRFLASVMALVMLLSLAPVGALAAGETPTNEECPAVTQPADADNQQAVADEDNNTPTPQPAVNPNSAEATNEATKLEGDLDLDEGFSVGADDADTFNDIAEQNLGSNKSVQEQSITAEYWVTNARVTAQDNQSLEIQATDSRITSETGALVETLAPGTGTQADNNVIFWQARVLSGEDKQTNGGGVDSTSKGKEIQSIRYYNSEFSYQEKGNTQWTEFTIINGKVQEQLVFYYMIKANFEQNVSVAITDWPNTDKNQIPYDAPSPHQVNYEVWKLADAGEALDTATKLGETVPTYYNSALTISAIKVSMNDNQQYYIRNIVIDSTKGQYDNPAVTDSEAEFSLNLKTAGEDRNLSRNGVITIKIYVTAYKYELAYQTNEGRINDSSYSKAGYYLSEVPINAPTDVTKTGYTFAGWYTDEECTGENKWTTGSTMPSEKLTLYAKWDENNYTVHYNLNYVDAQNPTDRNNVHWNDANLLPSGSFSREGYNFDGWYTQSTGGKKVTDTTTYASIAGNDATPSVTLYAHWNQNSEPTTESTPVYVYFKIVDAAGNNIKDKSKINNDDLKKTVYNNDADKKTWATLGKIASAETLTDGREYKGINATLVTVGNEAKNQLKNDGALHTDNKEIANTVLANIEWFQLKQWAGATGYVSDGSRWHLDGKITGYTVTYNNGTTEATDSVHDMPDADEMYYLSGSEYTVSDATPTREGYVFTGWKSNIENDTTIYNAKGKFEMPAKNVVLTAQWEKDELVDPSVDNPEGITKGDGIADKYQIQVSFKAMNGTFKDGENSITEYTTVVTKYDNSTNKPSENGTAKLAAAHLKTATPNEGHKLTGWTKNNTGCDAPEVGTSVLHNDYFVVTFEEGEKPPIVNPTTTIKYTINQHFMNGKGEKDSDLDKPGTTQSADKDTALSDLIKDLAKDQPIGKDKYMYVSGKYTTKSESQKDQPIESGSKLTEDTTIDLYYYLDNWKDADNTTDKDSATGGDGIPDCYQVLVKYQSGDLSKGKIADTARTQEVLTIKDKEKNVYLSEGQVVASGSTAEATGNRCYFSNWTDTTGKQVGTYATLGELPLDAVGGKTYIFTANFDRSSGGGGGSSRPTVTIPDDVPTGLNGTDHYAYIIGYGNNDVRPQNNITRAEVATIFFRLLTDETREANMTKSNGYNDVKDGDWFCCAVSTLSKMGIIKGYEDGSFKPNDPISRAEFAAIAARFDPDGDKTPATFADVTSHWAKDEISIAANHGWIKGYEDGSFKPNQKITRAETMTLVNRVLNRLPEAKDDLHKDMKTWVDNMDETAWYYLAVQEATNSHYFKNKTGTKFEQWTDLRDTRDWSELEK